MILFSAQTQDGISPAISLYGGDVVFILSGVMDGASVLIEFFDAGEWLSMGDTITVTGIYELAVSIRGECRATVSTVGISTSINLRLA